MNTKAVCKLILLVCLSLSNTSILAETAQPAWYYTVKPGDNLITIARVHLLNADDWPQIQKLNGIQNPYKMPIGLVLKVPLALVKHQPASARVMAFSGQALVKKNGRVTPLSMDQQLGLGEEISTGADSSVTIRFADGTLSKLAANTTVSLDTMSLYSGGAMVDTQLRLQQGQLETHANPKANKGNRLQITTPSAIAAVRGTEFRVSAAENAVTQETLSGQVDFASAQQVVSVNRGFGTVAVDGRPPALPVPLLPAVDIRQFPTYLEIQPVQFALPKLEGAVTWLGRVSRDPAQSQVVAERETSSDRLVLGTLEDGQYYLLLRAKDNMGIAGYDATHVFTVNTQPSAPQLIVPAPAGLMRPDSPELRWSSSPNADFYLLQVAQSPTFDTGLVNQRVQTTQHLLQYPLTAGRYYWRVAAITRLLPATTEGYVDEHMDQGPFSDVGVFDYRPLPPQPDTQGLQVRVDNNRVFVTTTPPLAGMRYQLRLANPRNQQHEVWTGVADRGEIAFDLREFGPQQLYLHYLDEFGVAGPPALVEFDAFAQY